MESFVCKEKVFTIKLKGQQKFTRLFGDSSKLRGLRSGWVILKPKEAVGEHNTGLCEEVIAVISGTGLIHYGKTGKIKVNKDSFIYIPPQTPHNVINSGSKLLKYIYVAAKVL